LNWFHKNLLLTPRPPPPLVLSSHSAEHLERKFSATIFPSSPTTFQPPPSSLPLLCFQKASQ
jgi:hypothetical protein